MRKSYEERLQEWYESPLGTQGGMRSGQFMKAAFQSGWAACTEADLETKQQNLIEGQKGVSMCEACEDAMPGPVHDVARMLNNLEPGFDRKAVSDAEEACEDCYKIIVQLIGALSKYGRHRGGCAVYRSGVFPKDHPEFPCDCGYEAAGRVRGAYKVIARIGDRGRVPVHRSAARTSWLECSTAPE